jgi:aminopeptidase N
LLACKSAIMSVDLQAASNRPGNVQQVKELTKHSAFQITNPNCCYSLLLAFARSAVNFHAADGSGYEFLAEMTLAVDKVNHQVRPLRCLVLVVL